MTVAVVSDIHGNLPALRAVVSDARRLGVSAILCCGDIASGPLPRETIEYLIDLDIRFRSVRGNADRCAVESYDGVADESAHEDDLWTGQQLDPLHREFLANLPKTLMATVGGLGRILLCHGSVRRDDEVIIETTPPQLLLEAMGDPAVEMILCGNTHMQFDRTVNGVRVVNPGSVGWPYGEAGAFWALLGPRLEFRRTRYDLEAAIEEMRRLSKWPRIDTYLESLPDPPSREAALEFFRTR